MQVPGTIVYTASLKPLEDEALFQHYYRLLPDERRRKTDRMKNPAVRKESLGAGVLLALALSDLGILKGPEGPADGRALRIGETEYEKPYLMDFPKIHFNLSHTAGRVLCIVSGAEAGCDAERIHLKEVDSLLRFFHKNEADWVREVSGQERILRFTRLWTLKESYVKAVGKGLSIPLDSFEIRMPEDCAPDPGNPSGAGGEEACPPVLREPFLVPAPGEKAFLLRELRAPEGYCFSCCYKEGDPGFSAKEMDLETGTEYTKAFL